MVFHWSLRDSKFPQLSITFLSILTDLNVTVCIVLIGTLISSPLGVFFFFFFRLCVLFSAPHYTTIAIIVNLMFNSPFSIPLLVSSICLSLFSLCGPLKRQNPPNDRFFFSGHLIRKKWPVCISKSWGISCISFSKTHSTLCQYHLVVWSNLNSLMIIFPTQSCLVFNSFFG